MADPIEASSIYVAEYSLDTSDYNESILDIDKILDGQNVIRSYVKDGSQGQVFAATGGGNRVQLDYRVKQTEIIKRWMMMMKKVATANPSVPPFSSPRFHPKYIPEIT
jgi:hypothetical protein